MTLQKINGKKLAQMILSGAHNLSNNAKKIDALNVFPVPDGDTGTNMNLTITSGANEVKKLTSDSVSEVAEAFAKGLLMGARGNSGVILSQIFRGFSKGLEKKEAVTTMELAKAFESGVSTAYNAVMKPVEGTILTVAKDAGNQAVSVAEKEQDIIQLMEQIVAEAKASLKRTPDLLPVLKEVGVVDSGGQGLLTIYEGFLAALKGEELPEDPSDINMDEMINAEHHKVTQDFMDTEDIEFGYCTEFMVKFEEDKLNEYPFDEEAFRNDLSEHGDSLLVVSDDELVKVHIHAEYPGHCLTMGQRYGSLINMKIENMREQHTAIVGSKEKKNMQKEKSEYAIVTVAMGKGLRDLLESLGASVVIEGGQTMNPSTQDIANAIKQANAKNVLMLPNNKNILMAADQAAELAEENVRVVPTKTIPQGISAMLSFHPDADIDSNQQAMDEARKQVKTGQITYAVRDTQIDGITIENGNFMGIADGKIIATDSDKMETVKLLLNEMISKDDEILTILQGEDVEDEEVNRLIKYIEETYEDIEIEVHNGNQPIYSYIFSVE
ncbi:DAK2 domain-containing protein [Virgibacillus sp. AGTR]|uniref:DAK2 domain-containing protein n=1 Tax=unclassified Virgibacillus TaxID=2620237 RepID=UPI0019660393|nr:MULTISPECIES: DAK2 domain-containing protein [unclassified Virgibacillus]MCC2251902.1 DAK2 domain-containing protein [Virgibacillus sp. AGTR]MDY7046724.1 DAK2 domain-containing protein [Virgibacillus sp. M23]QRZ17358.1 DAK2 domain-containing protein [Virgibacillus sp. AGTR]